MLPLVLKLISHLFPTLKLEPSLRWPISALHRDPTLPPAILLSYPPSSSPDLRDKRVPNLPCMANLPGPILFLCTSPQFPLCLWQSHFPQEAVPVWTGHPSSPHSHPPLLPQCAVITLRWQVCDLVRSSPGLAIPRGRGPCSFI